MKLKSIAKYALITAGFLTAGLTLAATNDATPTQQTFSPEQKTAIQKIVHDYLVNHPEVLVEASQKLQEQMQVKAQAEAITAIKKNGAALFNNSQTPVAGNPNGNVLIVEFFDYQCGHCKTMNTVVQALIKQNPTLKVVFKEFPIFGNNSELAARAALAANKQDKYYAFHDALLAADNPLTENKVFKIAHQLGLNIEKLKADMQSTEVTNELKQNYQLGEALGLQGTPAFIVSDKSLNTIKFIPGATSQENLQDQINQVKEAEKPQAE